MSNIQKCYTEAVATLSVLVIITICLFIVINNVVNILT